MRTAGAGSSGGQVTPNGLKTRSQISITVEIGHATILGVGKNQVQSNQQPGEPHAREAAGARQWAEAEADAALAAAGNCLAELDLDAEVRAEFAGIAGFITAREW